MPRHTGILNIAWDTCQRCNREWPCDQLRKQKGLKLCPECLDDLSIEYRPKVIAEVLASGPEHADEVAEVVEAGENEVPTF
jgi:hypothetical protein